MSTIFPCGIPKKTDQKNCPKHGFPKDCEKAIRDARKAEEENAKVKEESVVAAVEASKEEAPVSDTIPPTGLSNALKEMGVSRRKKKDEG